MDTLKVPSLLPEDTVERRTTLNAARAKAKAPRSLAVPTDKHKDNHERETKGPQEGKGRGQAEATQGRQEEGRKVNRRHLRQEERGERPAGSPEDDGTVLRDSASLWQTIYQSGGAKDSHKKETFRKHQAEVEVQPEVLKALDAILPTFEGDKGIKDQRKLRDFLVSIAKHESLGGKHKVQLGGGPGRSAWQIEPTTAIDVVENSGLIGPKALSKLGVTKQELRNWAEDDWSYFLETWDELAATIATAKVLQSADHYGVLKELS